MLSDLVVFDAKLSHVSDLANFYLCLFWYAVAFLYAYVYAAGRLRQLRVADVDGLPTELADLRRGTDEVVTQLYDEVTRVRAGNTDVFQKLKEEINDLHTDDDKFVVELREHFTRVTQKNEAVEKLVTAATLRTRTLEAELDVLPAQLAGLRRGIHEVVTQLHDEVDRVQAANAQLHRELKDELIGRQRGNDEIVAELREHVTRLGHQNDAASVKMRALEAELDTQRQKHVELSDFARRAYFPPHAAVLAAAAKEERTRGNATVMAEVVRLSQESIECKVTVGNEVVVTDQSCHQSHPVVPLIIPNHAYECPFLDCTMCLIVTSFRVFKNDRQQLDDALAYICEIADEPIDAFGIYRLFLKELFSAIQYYERPGYFVSQSWSDICNRGFNFNELLLMIHMGDFGKTTCTRLERKRRKVFRFLRLKANSPYGIPAEFMENRRLRETCTGGRGCGGLPR